MATKKSNVKKGTGKDREDKSKLFPFTRENYVIMIIGLVVIAIGYLLMVGGGSPNSNEFHPDQIYSFRRITLSPIVILIGFAIEIYAIMKKPKEEKNAS